ncbi:MAG: acyl carrier protein [Oscillospiraceae bacterium]|nr:acyl carrier protein [Oscillospiraceae bacterium]
MKMSKEQLKDIIAEVLEIKASEINDDDNFVNDLAMNSLQMLDCIAEVEDIMDIRIPKTDIQSLNCVNRIVEYLEAL